MLVSLFSDKPQGPLLPGVTNLTVWAQCKGQLNQRRHPKLVIYNTDGKKPDTAQHLMAAEGQKGQAGGGRKGVESLAQ